MWNLTAESLRSGAWRGQVTTLRTSSTNPGRLFFLLQKRCPSLGVGANFARRCKMQHRWVTLSWGDEGFLWKSWGEKYGELWSSGFLGTWTLWRKIEVCCGVLVSLNIDIRFWNHVYFRYLWICTLKCKGSADVSISRFHPKSRGATEDDQTSLQFQQLVQQPVHPKTTTRHQGTSGPWVGRIVRSATVPPRTNGMVRNSSNRK